MSGSLNAASYIGRNIWVRTANGDEYSGELFCYDVTDLHSLILRERTHHGRAKYTWLKTSIVRELRALDDNQTQPDADLGSLPCITAQQIEAAARKGEEHFSSIRDKFGVGVSQDAQDVFDALAKTMPCRWSNQDIKCYEVIISAPYNSENCRGGVDSSELNRVKKVLDGIKMTRRAPSLKSLTSSEE
jgi:protein LSM12